jgi:hypothetical protein
LDVPVPEAWIDGYFDDYDRLTSSERARRLELDDDRLVEWLADRTAPGALDADVDRAWDVVVELVRRAPDPEVRAFVAAGPLEDLVRSHAERLADRLVDRTRSDPDFREAMRNVWGWESVPDAVRARLIPLVADDEAQAAEALRALRAGETSKERGGRPAGGAAAERRHG